MIHYQYSLADYNEPITIQQGISIMSILENKTRFIPDTKQITRRKFLKTLAAAAGSAAVDWTALGALAAQVPDKRNIPVTVIGSGLGGLVSAAYLCKYGFDVTLFEQHSIPGGYATSFDRGDFTFDVSLHATVAEHAMPQMILSDLGLWDKLNIAYAPELRRIITDTYDVTLPAKNPEGVKNALSNVFPNETEGIHGFYSEMEQVIDELWGNKRFATSMMGRLEKLTLEQWMNRHVKDQDVKDCMAIFSGYYGLGPDRINALFYAIATGEYLVHGGQYYKTRSQDLSDTLAQGVEKTGGTILYNTRVDRILFDTDKRIAGVRTFDGKTHPARIIVANCPIPALINQMIPPQMIPSSFAAKAKERRASQSSIIVWLGLDKPIRHIRDYEIDIAAGRPQKNNSLVNAKDPAQSDIGVTIYDNLFDGYSPPEKSTLSIMCLADYAYWQKYEADYFADQKDAYNTEKERIAQAFIRRVEDRLIPGLSNAIEVMEIGTPLTNVFYTGNTNGAIYGFDRDQTHLESKTPIKGLYLSSAWSHCGGYTPVMMAGRQTAGQILTDIQSKKI